MLDSAARYLLGGDEAGLPRRYARRVPRPSLLTDELRARAELELAAGTPVSVTAQRIGVGVRTLTRWIADGRVVRRVDLTPEQASTLTSFDEQFDRAEPGLVGVVVAAAHRGSWQAASWLLERRWPDRWARPPARQPDDGLPGPADGDVFAEVDRLAEQRRRRRRDYGLRIPTKGR
jgi:hypothetical protein